MATQEEYKVELEVFEGPLDLLLYLIKKEELDIYDIPIERITTQYMEYLNVMKMLDLNIAGEFIVMAATLMMIKSRMLLPVDEREEMEEEEEMLRTEPTATDEPEEASEGTAKGKTKKSPKSKKTSDDEAS